MPTPRTGEYKTCLVCGNVFYARRSMLKKGWGKCCSHICQHKNRINYIKKICCNCGKEILVIPSRIKKGGGKFCSYKCRGEFYRGKSLFSPEGLIRLSLSHMGEKHWNWKGGKSQEPYGSGWTRVLKESIRIRDNYICQKCGVSQSQRKEALIVHHIDKIKDNLDPQNLTSLCRSCHSKLHNGDNINRSK